MRRIVHLDADAFYAAVEQRDRPELRGRPIAVGSGARRGVVMTASYEARRFGVRSAMPSAQALRLCPELQFVPARMDAYAQAGRALLDLYRSYTDLVEPLALDEAYLDVSDPKRGPASGTRIAQAIRHEAVVATGLIVSAGVSYCKLLAKLASDDAKPDGLRVVPPNEAGAFLTSLPVRRIHGVGPRTAERLAQLGTYTAGQLGEQDPAELEARFGKLGRHLWLMARGEDDRPVRPDRERKSVSSETTFDRDRVGVAALLEDLPAVCASTARRAGRARVAGRVVVVKIKDADHRIVTRQRRTARPVASAAELRTVAAQLLRERVPVDRPVRLLGVGLADLVPEGAPEIQPALFPGLVEVDASFDVSHAGATRAYPSDESAAS
ncbi:MAG: DNA polymerase IV [Trueperaceae bacterium]|nr:DNA polymerase IV [Trueperaceae bacterium]